MYERVKGCFDILPDADEEWKTTSLWRFVESEIHGISGLFGFKEIRTPVFEAAGLFNRAVGDETDIVGKEMYTFEDRGGRVLSLRPELTAPVMRAYIEHGLRQKGTNHLYYMGPCWRYNRAQKGRYRQFHQWGVEVIGVEDPLCDAEVIMCMLEFFNSVGLRNLKLLVNSIGDFERRKVYSEALREYIRPGFKELSEDSKRRFETNPMRILDSKDVGDQEIVRGAPKILEFVDDASSKNFENILSILGDLGIEYTIDHSLVRGLDYYCDTVFEVIASEDAATQNTIGAGGRYNGLMKALGGEDLAGIGFAVGIERVLQLLLSQGVDLCAEEGPSFFFMPLSESGRCRAVRPMFLTRQSGVSAVMNYGSANIKKGLQKAVSCDAKYAVIIGDDECKKDVVKLKKISSHEEVEVPMSFFDDLLTNIEELERGFLVK